ncbi:hypothetical protein FGB62_30g347 [Gracilaria domingensis]|nr:hypothetical protein FGB62_30g347 [Gracilaria domingensis]
MCALQRAETMRFVLIACALLPAVLSSPTLVAPSVRAEDGVSRAADIDGATFELVASAPDCVPVIEHGTVRYPPFEAGVSLALNLSPPEALIPFDNITVAGDTCARGHLDDVLALFDPSKIALTDVGVDADDIPHIYVAGVDAAGRVCASSEYAPRVYLYTSQLQHLFRANQRFGGVELQVTERTLDNEHKAMFMLSIPRNEAQSACLYRRRVEGAGDSATTSSDGEPESSAESDDDDEELDDEEESASGTDEPEDEPELASQPAGPSTFATAKEEAMLQEEEALLAREKNNRCFPAAATVQLEDGRRLPMSQLQIGHRVLVAPGVFSPVFMFTHKLNSIVSDFVHIRTHRGDQLSVTASHFIYLDSKLLPAGNAAVGQQVQLEDGSMSSISHVSVVQLSGLYNPQTLHGDIIVDNIRASTFTEAVQPIVAQSVLAPLRFLFDRFALSTLQFDNGGDALLSILQQPLSYLSRA